MIKFYKNYDISESDLLVCFSSIGLSGNFASSLLINNNSFENIGFYFSHYLSASVSTSTNNQTTYNGEVYFNPEKKVLILNFFFGTPQYYKNKFFEEFMYFHKNNKLKRIIVYSGIGKSYQNDEELTKKIIDVYFISNTQEAKNYGMRNFEEFVNLENKKPFKELEYVTMSGSSKNLVKYLYKNNYNFIYLFTFSGGIFDPAAGVTLYNRLCNILGINNNKEDIQKGLNPKYFLEDIGKKLKFEDTWRLLLE